MIARSGILRIGVAGLGFGADVHVPALRQLPQVEVVALAGRNMERTKAIADRLGVPHACSPATALLNLDLDAVSLALPPDQTEDVVIAALGKGIGVLCEKPIAERLDSAKRMSMAARGRVTAVDFQFAELAMFAEFRRLILSRCLGDVRHANVVWLTESWAQRQRSWSWKTDGDLGGGVLALFGSHLLYLAEWLFGPVRRLNARCDRRATREFAPVSTKSAEDLVHLLMVHENDVPISVTFGNANPGLSIHRWIVVFERGSVCLENTANDYMADFNLTVSDKNGMILTKLIEPREEGDGRIPPFRRLAARFIDALRNGNSCEPDLAQGARVQQLMGAVSRSADSTEGWVVVPG